MNKNPLLFAILFAFMAQAADTGCTEKEESSLVRDDEEFRVVLNRSYVYCYPAAHENYMEEVVMYRKSDGKRIGFEDIFTADTATVLKIVNENRKKALNENILGEPNDGMAESAREIHSVFLAPKGVGFTWCTYHVNNGAAGPISVILPYKYFKGILRKKF